MVRRESKQKGKTEEKTQRHGNEPRKSQIKETNNKLVLTTNNRRAKEKRRKPSLKICVNEKKDESHPTVFMANKRRERRKGKIDHQDKMSEKKTRSVLKESKKNGSKCNWGGRK